MTAVANVPIPSISGIASGNEFRRRLRHDGTKFFLRRCIHDGRCSCIA